MAHDCSDCGETFETLTRLRLHDCPADEEAFTVRIQARLITNDSPHYAQTKARLPDLNENQPVFPNFDMAVEPGKPVPPKAVQQKVNNAVDDIFREEHDLWEWAATVSKERVRATPPGGEDETQFKQVGTIEVSESGDIVDTFVTLDELKASIAE